MPANGETLQALVVDDEADFGVARLCIEFLRSLNYDVTVAKSIQEAKRHLQNTVFHLAITDGFSGLGWQLVEEFEDRQIPFILVSGNQRMVEAAVIQEIPAIEKGSEDFLPNFTKLVEKAGAQTS